MNARKNALITGITGQDGSYLAELLLSKGYEVHGLVRRSSSLNRERLSALYARGEHADSFHLHYGDLSDGSSLLRAIDIARPDEIYNLGAQSHVRVSFDMPEYTMDVVGLGTVRLLEAIRHSGIVTKLYQASSSEMYGAVLETPQNERTPFNPRSPYAIAKLLAHNMAASYRASYGLFACNGILFNHESPRRGENFVTRKITRAVAEIVAGKRDKLLMGNIHAKRDWGYAPDYVLAMWLMLQQEKPDDYVIATGEVHTVKEFLEACFSYVGVLKWKHYIEIDPRLFRPAEVELLVGDARKAQRKLGWKPKVKFHDLVKIMMDAELEQVGLQKSGMKAEKNRLTLTAS